MNNPWYDGCSSAAEVDRITGQRINAIHGSPADELKNLRKGQLAVLCIIRPHIFSPSKQKELLAYGDQLILINGEVEKIVAEAKSYKKSRGW